MGHLDEAAFAAQLAPCTGCGGGRHELYSVIDQWVPVMLAEAAGDPRWIHDGEKFIDGTYRIECADCHRVGFRSEDCPRCHAAGALPAALATGSRLHVPRKCPTCGENQLAVTALVPSKTVHTGGPARPKPIAELGDDGFHVLSVVCDTCGVIAEVGDDCPLCGAAGPIRPRP